MRADFQSAVDDIRKEVHDIGTRMGTLEERTDELCLANNEIVDKNHKMEADKQHLVEKMAYLEDRNNIHMCEVPETVTVDELPEYLQQLFLAIKPDLDKAQDVLRDIVTKLHYCSTKDAILTVQRKAVTISADYAAVALYHDL
ncbi:Hypothetical predicted protein [Pelobates cultripes]|uniref:Uncharacterized protein n=1 Tax=Pelobates cultripes TaxID=61616 RepID=A0AAD1TCQ7_PELCU|nr:Hypothetical predicted protein [Pelobates cultripes]